MLLIYVSKTVLLLLTLINPFLCQQQDPNKRQRPQVKILFSEIADKDFSNQTVSFITNFNAKFQLQCNAPYPIEWILDYSEHDDGTSEKSKSAENRRIVREITDEKSYMYQSILTMEYKGKMLALVQFTCQATQSNRRLSKIFVNMRWGNTTSVLILEISNKNRGTTALKPRRSNAKDCSKATFTVLGLRSLDTCWNCINPTNGNQLQMDFVDCHSATQCNSMHFGSISHDSRISCIHKNTKEDGSVEENCKMYYRRDYNPKFVVCKNFGPELVQFYFFGVFRGNAFGIGPPMYFDWSEINPSEMLYLHHIKGPHYIGESINVTCEYSKFYFALGSWFGIKSNQGMLYIPGNDIKPCETETSCYEASKKNLPNDTKNAWRGTFRATREIKLVEGGPHVVQCFGPVWNSTEWVNTSTTIFVQEGEIPRVTSLAPDEGIEFSLGDTFRKLRCNFSGKPAPKPEWTIDSHIPTDRYVFNEEGDCTELIFLLIDEEIRGNYICSVSSVMGNDSKSYYINPKGKSGSTTWIVALLVFGVFIILVATVIIIHMRRTIVEQRKALRDLTEKEIHIFVEGNPDMVERAQTEYFDNVESIDALPYKKSLEIPPERLTIDFSTKLGAGEHGLVLKGKLKLENDDQYFNINQYGSFSTTSFSVKTNSAVIHSEVTVAVKTCTKNIDVSNFKAILSEVKVMAYLGHHENLVTLIGACTAGIRSRELVMVLEYCKNGSLESYLRANKEKLQNQANNGCFVEECELLVGNQFAPLQLLNWTSDIAKALDFIHSKRVIHGDLASRNILLTNILTAKVGDFGLSRQLVGTSCYTKKTRCPLPWRNMAIESLKQLQFSVKSDIWALGITLWEIYTLGDKPYVGMRYNSEFIKLLQGGMRPPKPNNIEEKIFDFMLLCWDAVPDNRPSVGKLQDICDAIKGGNEYSTVTTRRY